MAAKEKQQNISIQPVKRLPSIKIKFELPREGLTEDDLMRKSTSDKTKRRVAHVAWFPLPVLKKSIPDPKTKKRNDDPNKNRPMHFYQQCSETSHLKYDRKGKPKKIGSTVSPVQRTKNDSVSAKKRKSEDREDDVNETPKKRQKRGTSSIGSVKKSLIKAMKEIKKNK